MRIRDKVMTLRVRSDSNWPSDEEGPMRRVVSKQEGLTIAEILVVIAIVGLFLAVTIPAASNYIRSSRVRTAADTLAMDLQSCRYMAVTNRTPRTLALVGGAPATAYTYTDLEGTTHTVYLPEGIQITTATNFPVTFTSLGGLTGSPATAVVKGTITGSKAHEFTLSVGTSGKVTRSFNPNATP
jgi:type II secretory pathway pseudopilin PulG